MKKLILPLACLLFMGCGVSAPAGNPAAIDASKEPLKAYAAELRYQYDLILGDSKAGVMSQADVDKYVASWNRIGGFYGAAKAAYLDLPDQAQKNFVNESLKYPWIAGGTVNNSGTLVAKGFSERPSIRRLGNSF